MTVENRKSLTRKRSKHFHSAYMDYCPTHTIEAYGYFDLQYYLEKRIALGHKPIRCRECGHMFFEDEF